MVERRKEDVRGGSSTAGKRLKEEVALREREGFEGKPTFPYSSCNKKINCSELGRLGKTEKTTPFR